MLCLTCFACSDKLGRGIEELRATVTIDITVLNINLEGTFIDVGRIYFLAPSIGEQ